MTDQPKLHQLCTVCDGPIRPGEDVERFTDGTAQHMLCPEEWRHGGYPQEWLS